MKTDISIIMPVLNEQAGVNQTIENLYQQQFSGVLEVIVVDGGKDKGTIDRILNPKIITLSSLPGRGRQMNAGASVASGEILLFLHCDTKLPVNALERVQETLKTPSIEAGAFDLSIDGKGRGFRMIEKFASVRSRITRIPYGDQAIFIRKNYFFDLGQYRNIPIMEDVDLMRRIKRARGKIQILNYPASTSARRWEKEGKIYCTLRNWILISLFLLGLKPDKLAAFYKNNPAQ